MIVSERLLCSSKSIAWSVRLYISFDHSLMVVCVCVSDSLHLTPIDPDWSVWGCHVRVDGRIKGPLTAANHRWNSYRKRERERECPSSVILATPPFPSTIHLSSTLHQDSALFFFSFFFLNVISFRKLEIRVAEKEEDRKKTEAWSVFK